MARGRYQKWICKDCRSEFSVQGHTPKFCCSCGSANIGRAPSYELAVNFEQKRQELREICMALNPVYRQFAELKAKYDRNIDYWRTQRKRGYISKEEFAELAGLFIGNEDPDMAISAADAIPNSTDDDPI